MFDCYYNTIIIEQLNLTDFLTSSAKSSSPAVNAFCRLIVKSRR